MIEPQGLWFPCFMVKNLFVPGYFSGQDLAPSVSRVASGSVSLSLATSL